jgi:hypothetical protein
VARRRADPALFERLTAGLEPGLRERIGAAVAAVHDARAEMDRSGEVSYQAWRAGTRERIETSNTTEGGRHAA